jgi:hypothetical protein
VITHEPTIVYNSTNPPTKANVALKALTPTKVAAISNDPTTFFYTNINLPTNEDFVLKTPTPTPMKKKSTTTKTPKQEPKTYGQKEEPISVFSVAAVACIVIILIASSIIIIVAFFPFRCSSKGAERALKDDDTSPNEIENPPSVVIIKASDEVSGVGQFSASPQWKTNENFF